jgi:hypothetical protein
MVITITSLELRRLWHFFIMTFLALRVVLQLRRHRDFVTFRNTGFGYRHYTLTVWASDEGIDDFARSGAHAKAMRWSKRIAREIRTHTYRSETIPTWNEVRALLSETGRVYSFGPR